jgi:L-lactate dehydrogenase
MKLGIVGTGQVGCAIALAAVTRGSAREIVLVNRTRKTAEAVATDIRYGTPLCDRVEIRDADYDGLEGAGLVLITSGVNEKTGGAIDRSDPEGRLKLLDQNAAIYREIVPKIVRAAPKAVLVAVTDPPDPLADIAREAAGHDRVLSTGTFPGQLAISRSSRQAFWRQAGGCRGAGDWRPWHLGGVLMVVSPGWRCPGDLAFEGARREAR